MRRRLLWLLFIVVWVLFFAIASPAWLWFETPFQRLREASQAAPPVRTVRIAGGDSAPALERGYNDTGAAPRSYVRPRRQRRLDVTASCLEETGVDLRGGDLRSGAEQYDVAGPASCCALCAAVTPCWGWVYRSDWETCYLKGSRAVRGRGANLTAGYVRGRRWMADEPPDQRTAEQRLRR
eukprot:TRINITY_DN6488_c0_g1_i1.p1 TRINITY_DN6488_c0_g1~~TRINITY_DN6488_c0_g1_i1.p1  ORF type:complete len:206 (+),score=45.92 TRINITY_DN6488_c0_g1_i1:76-618(+)